MGSTAWTFRRFVGGVGLPEMWMKQCVSTAMVSPEARQVVMRTEETEAPMPAPAAAPHTMNT